MEYFKRFKNSQKVFESYEGSLIQEGVLNYGRKLLIYDTAGGYDILSGGNKILANKAGEEIMTATIYLENADDARYYDVNKRVENDYFLKKAEYPKTAVKVKILLQNFQPTSMKQPK